MTEIVLPERVNVSSREARSGIELLYRAQQHALLSYLTRLLGDVTLAEDVCQDTFIKALRGWNSRDPAGNEVNWLYRIARNSAYDELRRRQRITFEMLNDDLVASTDEDTMLRCVNDAELSETLLARLPAAYRLPLLLYVWGDYRISEIADRLGCSQAAVKIRLFRARKLLRQMYGDPSTFDLVSNYVQA